MPRLFTGLEIPDGIRESLSMLRGGLPGARWIDAENYHLTLRFIGDVDDVVAQRGGLYAWQSPARAASSCGSTACRRSAAASRVPSSPRWRRRIGDGIAGRARAADAAGRHRARRPQVHATRHAGAASRHIEPGRCRISLDARRLPFPPFQVSRFVLFSSRASSRRRALRGRGGIIRSRATRNDGSRLRVRRSAKAC